MAKRDRVPMFLARRAYRRRRLIDAARLLPVFAGFLVLVPLLWDDGRGDAPVMAEHAAYLFVIWALFVAAAAALAAALRPSDLNLPKGAKHDADAGDAG